MFDTRIMPKVTQNLSPDKPMEVRGSSTIQEGIANLRDLTEYAEKLSHALRERFGAVCRPDSLIAPAPAEFNSNEFRGSDLGKALCITLKQLEQHLIAIDRVIQAGDL